MSNHEFVHYVVNADKLVSTLIQCGAKLPNLKYSHKGTSFYNLIAHKYDMQTLLEGKKRIALTALGVYDRWTDAFVHFETDIDINLAKCVPKGMDSLIKFHKGVQFVEAKTFSTEVLSLLVKVGALGPAIEISKKCILHIKK